MLVPRMLNAAAANPAAEVLLLTKVKYCTGVAAAVTLLTLNTNAAAQMMKMSMCLGRRCR
jgi:glutamine synthetase adenylyltransferase